MTFVSFISSYLTLNILVILGFFISENLRASFWGLTHEIKLKITYFSLFVIFVVALIQPVMPTQEIFKPALKVWSAESIKTFSQDYEFAAKSGYLRLPTPNGVAVISAKRITILFITLSSILFLYGIFKIVGEIIALEELKKNAYLIRKIGKTRIFLHDRTAVPFSFLQIGQANVILPNSVISNRNHFKISLAHEIQHHRQSDTFWVYPLWVLRLLCFLNPFVYIWHRKISELQEFACDEALLRQSRVEPQAYASCLIEVAQSAFHQKYVPACATGLTFLVERNLIKRRIETMLNFSRKKTSKKIAVILCTGIAALLLSTAYASKSFVQDRRVSLEKATLMASNAKVGSDFPIVVNDLVLVQLNKYIGTPEGRNFMRDSLQRMENYRVGIEGKMSEYHMPLELMAVPIIESGYQNLAEKNKQGWGAGLWMFIKPTAINYGLKVDNSIDERLNVEKLTDAAIRYLKANQSRFKDWNLSTLAYNIGENNVQKAIDKTGSRDPWVLIQNGYENDKDYLPKLMAAILIMKNPSVLD